MATHFRPQRLDGNAVFADFVPGQTNVVNATGAVQAQEASTTGRVNSVVRTSGAVQAQPADTTGTVQAINVVTATGAVAAQDALTTGQIIAAAKTPVNITGTVQGQAATAAGLVLVEEPNYVTTSGAVQAEPATTTGLVIPFVTITATGATQAEPATTTGTIGEQQTRAPDLWMKLPDNTWVQINDYMQFIDPYVPGDTYYSQQTVLVDGWTMAANKTTSDYPAPTVIGSQFNFYNGVNSTSTDTVKQVIQGNRYSNPTNSYQILSYFVYTITGQDYDVYMVKDPLGDKILTNLNSFEASNTGWQKFNVTPVIVEAGTVLDLVAVTTEPADTPVTVDAQYSYNTPQNHRVPATGEIVQSRGTPELMSIHHIDNQGTDRTSLITGLIFGDKISNDTGSEWLVQTNTNQGTYSDLVVSPATVGSAVVQIFSFETTVPTPIEYLLDPDYWLSTPYTINGIIAVDDTYPNATINDTAYGTDLEVIDVSLSEDWDIVAPGDAAASSEQQLTRDETAWVQASSAEIEVYRAITSGSAWTEIARFPIPLDTGVKASLTVDANRTDGFGKYSAEYAALAFNNGGTLDVSGVQKFDLGQTNLDVRETASGTDLVFEVKGRPNQDWAWRMVVFFRGIQ